MLVLLSFSVHAQDKTIAILGDSISTGAVAHPDLEFDGEKLWNIFRGRKPLVIDPQFSDPPRRLWPTIREYIGSLEWLSLGAIYYFSRQYLDAESYSWGNLLAKKLGFSGSQTLLAAQDGARMLTGPRQVDRVLEANGGMLPHKMFIFFTGNDLCGPTLDYITSKADYGQYLKATIEYATAHGAAPPGGTEVYVLAYLGVLQISGSNTILNKKVTAHGKQTTCRELADYREGFQLNPDFVKNNPESYYFFRFFPNNPAMMCPTLFEKNLDFEQGGNQRILLANHIQGYRDAAKQMVQDLYERAKAKSVTLRFVDSTSNLIFEEGDIANDCFHLSKQGQSRLSEVVFQGMGS